MTAHFFGNFGIDRTGVALLIGDADGGQEVDHTFALDFELPGQIIDANFFH
jgi:hypothetical protein